MASQRIVLTSPWKLGLFVFLLVVGCGFGLIYAYLRYFGGSLDFADEQALKSFYIVCGSVAGLGMLGYLAVIASARPMVGMAKDKQRREKLLKKFGQLKDVRKANPDDFAGEPALASALERWIEAIHAVEEAEQAAQSQRETIAELSAQIEGGASGQPVEQAAVSDEAASIELLRDVQRKLFGIARSIAQNARELNHSSQAAATPQNEALEAALLRSSARLAENREQLELLAEESNRLAIQAALQVSRISEPNAELMQVTDDLRALSTRYQRLASELRLCEGDNEEMQSAWNESATAPAADSIRSAAMVLIQGATDLKELAAALLPSEASAYASAAVTPVEAAAPIEEPVQSEAIPEPNADAAELDLELDPTAFEMPADDVSDAEPQAADEVDAAEESEQVYDLDEFGGRELDESGEPIYDLREFEAVEL